MDSRNFSLLQKSLDNAGVYTTINKLGKSNYEVIINFSSVSRCKTRITAKRRIIDKANQVFNIKLNRYQ